MRVRRGILMVAAFRLLVCPIMLGANGACAFIISHSMKVVCLIPFKSKHTRVSSKIPIFDDTRSPISNVVSMSMLSEDSKEKEISSPKERPQTLKMKDTKQESSQKSGKIISIDLSKYEEKEKREMEWLVKTTSKVLGLDEES